MPLNSLWGIGASAPITTRCPDEYAVLTTNLLASGDYAKKDIDDAIIASVVPPVTDMLCEMLHEHFDIDPLIVGSGCKTGVAIRVDNPREGRC